MRLSGMLVRAWLGAVVVGLVVTLLPGAAEARPRNPSSREIAAAQAERARRATDVGRLTGLVAKADGDMRRATDRAELAVERYNKAVVDLGVATGRAQAARAAAQAAERSVVTAHRDFSGYARGSYIEGNSLMSAATLLGSSSPTDLLERAALLSYASSRRLAALSELDLAKVRRANAESLARQALANQQQATVQAARAKQEAAAQVAAAQAQLAALQAQRASLQRQLETARVALNGLYAERARYQAWQRAQAIAAARERERLRRAREEVARRLAAEAAAGGDRSSGGPPRYVRSGGRWSAAKGQWVADAATRWLGTAYAWGGGNDSGPTYGVNGPGAGFADGSVIGFDCSGLAMWAWAQVGIYLPHYSGYQYTSGQHVALGDLRPGDLVFWAYDTSDPSTIHHVAIYIGGGRVIQAPESGDVVRISPMWFDGYIGATRPGT